MAVTKMCPKVSWASGLSVSQRQAMGTLPVALPGPQSYPEGPNHWQFPDFPGHLCL